MDHPRAAEQWLWKVRDRAPLAGRTPGLKSKVVVIQTIFEGHVLLPEIDP